ncbi:MAG: N-acetylneuraminate synthase family protein [Xanthomonadales bacterium]|jgi:N-acetylneuraminate synthase/N,N'-diacetyllegionaminate synthase|nr:N-acetylneuraminate synthase family protein [Xanthomonadales bacterium]
MNWSGRHGPLLIAEIGGNHEGSVEAAWRLTEQALAAGADVVKFQIYFADSLVSPVESPDRHRHFRRFELPLAEHLRLADAVRSAGAQYSASVWDPASIEALADQVAFFKVGSGDLTAVPLLRQLAATGKPILLSTGLATLAEVQAALDAIRAANPDYAAAGMLAVLQCTTSYPTLDAEVNLRVMDTLRAATGLPVGYSHHVADAFPLRVAAARGAEILEFHFTDQREGRSFRDHAISLTAAMLQELTADLGRIATLLGSPEKAPTPGELAQGHVQSFRRALYSRRALRAGERLQAQDLVCLRPLAGVDARDCDAVIGRAVQVDTPAFAALRLEAP